MFVFAGNTYTTKQAMHRGCAELYLSNHGRNSREEMVELIGQRSDGDLSFDCWTAWGLADIDFSALMLTAAFAELRSELGGAPVAAAPVEPAPVEPPPAEPAPADPAPTEPAPPEAA